MPVFCFKAKRADELAKKQWLKPYKEPSVWRCWLRIAHLLPTGLSCIANPFPSNLVSAHGFGHQLRRVNCITCPWQPDLPTLTFFLYHCWSKTSLGSGGCTKATNRIYKGATIGISSLWTRSPMHPNEPLQIKQKSLSTSLKDYLQINAFPASSGGAREEVLSSINESYWKPELEYWEKSPL